MKTKDNDTAGSFSLLVKSNGQMVELPMGHLKEATIDAIQGNRPSHLMPPLNMFNSGYLKPKKHDPL